MRLYNLRGKSLDPSVHRKVHILARSEHFQKHQVRLARVCDVVTRGLRHKTDVVFVEVHRANSLARKDRHTRLTTDVVLPFRSARMPVKFTHTTKFNAD